MKRVLAFSCVHAPNTDLAAFRWMLDHRSLEGVNMVVCLGDLLEAEAASVHPKESRHTLRDEYEMAANLLRQVERRLPKAKRTWMLGNHDDNIQRRDPRRISREVRDLLHWNVGPWGKVFERWDQRPYVKGPEGVLRVGDVRFYHGWDCGATSDESEALQVAGYTGWTPHTLHVRGHTHTPLDVTQCRKTARTPLPYYYMNVGHLGPTKPDYALRRDTGRWAHAFAVIEIARSGRWKAELHRRNP